MKNKLVSIPLTINPTIAANGHYHTTAAIDLLLDEKDIIIDEIRVSVINETDKPTSMNSVQVQFLDASGVVINSQYSLNSGSSSPIKINVYENEPIKNIGMLCRGVLISDFQFNNGSGTWAGADDYTFNVLLICQYV